MVVSQHGIESLFAGNGEGGLASAGKSSHPEGGSFVELEALLGSGVCFDHWIFRVFGCKIDF